MTSRVPSTHPRARSKHDPPERLYGHPGRPAESRSDKLCRVLSRLRVNGYAGSQTTIKNYILSHQHLIPPVRYAVAPQETGGGDTLQPPARRSRWTGALPRFSPTWEKNTPPPASPWSATIAGRPRRVLPDARQENLLIGMLHAFSAPGVPATVLTDNMKSVVVRRDADGRPVWQADYAEFMGVVASAPGCAGRATPIRRARWRGSSAS